MTESTLESSVGAEGRTDDATTGILKSLLQHLSVVADPRSNRGIRHPLINVLSIAVFGTMCGCNDAEALEDWGNKDATWLAEFLDMKHGPPSQDVFLRVLASLDQVAFRSAFRAWMDEVFLALGLKGQIAVDGQTHRRSHDHSAAKKALHRVHALWCESELVIAQEPTEQKSNEITAIPELLRLLDLRGALVSMDAMGAQVKIAQQIRAQGGDYLMGLKGNQSALHTQTQAAFREAQDLRRRTIDEVTPPALTHHTEVDKGHGRLETRTASVLQDFAAWVPAAQRWSGLSRLIAIEATREDLITGKVSTETRYYISSRTLTAEAANRAVRAHWKVENSLHHRLDVTFNQDACRTRRGNAAENLGVIRHFALNILRNYKGDAYSVPRRRPTTTSSPRPQTRLVARAS